MRAPSACHPSPTPISFSVRRRSSCRSSGVERAGVWLAALCALLLAACDPAAPGAITATPTAAPFSLTSPDVNEGGSLPKDYTCDGNSATVPLAWSNAPAGTREFALLMDHIAAPDDIHWYWIVYQIPATVGAFPRNMSGIGALGSNSVNHRAEYTPPCSKGPGAKTYTLTLFALSGSPSFTVAPARIDRAALLAAVQERTLARAQLNVTYARPR